MIYRTIVLVFLAALAFHSHAQSCNPYFSFREGVNATYEFYNAKGKVISRNANHFKDVSGSGNNLTATMVMEMIDVKKNVVTSSTETKWHCEDGVVRFQMNAMNIEGIEQGASGIEVTVDGDEMEIPSNLEAGQKLKDVNYHVVMNMGGIKMMDRNFLVKERQVEGKENITTPAGTFDCTKIKYLTESTGRGGNTTKPMQTTIWYAQDTGVVKTENYKDGKVQSTQLLTKIEK